MRQSLVFIFIVLCTGIVTVTQAQVKSNFKFWGVFSIIIISLYLLIFLIGMVGAAFGG